MRSSAAARRYARALFALARESGAVELVRGELAWVSAQLDESPALRAALLRPLHPVAERRAVMREVAQRQGLGRNVQNFLFFLIDQRRILDFDAICAEYQRLADEAAGRLAAQVVSASPLRPDQSDRLRRALATRVGCEVELDLRVDPELIGGAIARVGGLVFDGSLRTQLAQLRDNLTRG